jgi:hypothetical protein
VSALTYLDETLAYEIASSFVISLEWKRPSRRWEDNVKIDHNGLGYKDMSWVQAAHDREHSNEPSGKIKAGEFLDRSEYLQFKKDVLHRVTVMSGTPD